MTQSLLRRLATVPFCYALFTPAAVLAQSADTVLTLSAAVQRALATHPVMGMAAAERTRSAAQVNEAASARWPRIGTEWSGIRFQEPMIVAPLHGFDPRTPPQFDRTLLQGNLHVSHVLFDGGTRSARVARARAGVEVAEAAAEAALRDLLVRVTQVYVGVLTEREQLAAQRSRENALTAELDRVRRVEAEGRAARVEVLRAQAALSRARADAVSSEARLAQQEAELARLIAADAALVSRMRLVDVAPRDSLVLPARAQLLAQAGERSAAVRRARSQLAAADAAVSESRSARLPSLMLGARYNVYGSGAGDYAGEWQSTLHMSYALFTGGERSSAIERAGAERVAAAEAVRLAELEAAAAVDRALTAWSEARARVAALADAVAQLEEVVNVERLALDAGAGVQTDYLTAESQLLEARAALSAARHARTLARVELARATGELDGSWLISRLGSGS
jgi:outer membrane protein TolC